MSPIWRPITCSCTPAWWAGAAARWSCRVRARASRARRRWWPRWFAPARPITRTSTPWWMWLAACIRMRATCRCVSRAYRRQRSLAVAELSGFAGGRAAAGGAGGVCTLSRGRGVEAGGRVGGHGRAGDAAPQHPGAAHAGARNGDVGGDDGAGEGVAVGAGGGGGDGADAAGRAWTYESRDAGAAGGAARRGCRGGGAGLNIGAGGGRARAARGRLRVCG